jgi:hypothetical protein
MAADDRDSNGPRDGRNDVETAEVLLGAPERWIGDDARPQKFRVPADSRTRSVALECQRTEGHHTEGQRI